MALVHQKLIDLNKIGAEFKSTPELRALDLRKQLFFNPGIYKGAKK